MLERLESMGTPYDVDDDDDVECVEGEGEEGACCPAVRVKDRGSLTPASTSSSSLMVRSAIAEAVEAVG
jgi:hypothetical protein